MKKKLKTFTVQVKLDLFLDVDVKAETLEEALAAGKALDVRDVVEFDVGYHDGEITVVGVFG